MSFEINNCDDCSDRFRRDLLLALMAEAGAKVSPTDTSYIGNCPHKNQSEKINE